MSLPTQVAVSAGRRVNRTLGAWLHDFRRYTAGGVAIACTTILVRTYLYNWGDSSGASMYPTIPDRANILFVNKTYRYGRGIKVGDCVQIENPVFQRQFAGKRVIGMPGDYVLRGNHHGPTPGNAPLPGITDWRKKLDARKAVDEFGVHSAMERPGHGATEEEWAEPQMIQVPEGHVWLEGDNLSWSRDSRFYGPVPMALIKGRSSGYKTGLLSWTSLKPGEGLRKVEDWELDAVLGKEES